MTSFALRTPTDTYRPASGSPLLGYRRPPVRAAVQGIQAHPDHQPDPSEVPQRPRRSNPSYNDELAKVYHQWVTTVHVHAAVGGDHYLQIRTNVKIPVPLWPTARAAIAATRTSTPRPATTPASRATATTASRSGSPAPSGAPCPSRAGTQMSIYANYTGARLHVQPGAGDPGGRQQEPAHRASTTSATPPTPAPSRCCPRSTRTCRRRSPPAPAPASRTARCPAAS